MPIPPVLCYHKVDSRLELGFTQLAPRAFRRQMRALAQLKARTFGTAGLLEAAAMPAARYAFAAVTLTFDDGYAALEKHAFPVLEDHGYKSLVFVVTDHVGRDNSWDVRYGWRRFRHLDWDQLGRWQERGVEVQSHCANHLRLTWLSDDAVAEELGSSREEIERRLGRAPVAVSYPYGAVDGRVRRLAVQAGYTLGFAGPSQGKASDQMALPRLPVYGWDRFGLPLVLREGVVGGVARSLARFTNRMAVGTAAIQRLTSRRYRRRAKA